MASYCSLLVDENGQPESSWVGIERCIECQKGESLEENPICSGSAYQPHAHRLWGRQRSDDNDQRNDDRFSIHPQ